MNKKITDIRIQKEVQSLEKQPVPSVLVQRADELNFHFCFYHLQEDYKEGFYHGILELPQDYPFSPPKIQFLTNNGRFEVAKSICTTFTHYHKETWSSSWNIRTILTALISFMYSNERGIGGLTDPPHKRRALALKSLSQNLKNEQFVALFKDKLIELKLITEEALLELMSKGRRRQRSETTNTEDVREIPELAEPEGLAAIGEERMSVREKQGRAGRGKLRSRKREMGERFVFETEIAELELLEKRRKGEEGGMSRRTVENEEE